MAQAVGRCGASTVEEDQTRTDQTQTSLWAGLARRW